LQPAKRWKRICGAAGAAALIVMGSMSRMDAATYCVNPGGTAGCKSSIGAAVTTASAGDTVSVSPGTYKESVTIGIPLTLIGADAPSTTIDATGLGNGIYVDGIDNPNLAGVFISGFTVQNANYEGILITNASNVTISGNVLTGNDKSLITGPNESCPGQPAFETGEGFDCGEAIHLLGVWNSVVTGNTVQHNQGGILLSDDTGATHDNAIVGNIVTDNGDDCGITLASHVPAALTGSMTALGVYHNTISGNQSLRNGAGGEGAGVGLFASAPGTLTYGNLVLNNVLMGNGIPGVAVHGHTPGQKLDGNVIVGNQISGNGADVADSATPGTTGINVYSVSPVSGTVIAENTISGEQIAVEINSPGQFDVHRNSYADGIIGLLSTGKGSVNADGNWWGCAGGPGGVIALFAGCATTSGPVTVNYSLSLPPTK
jgi:parallel beta-helix repeat protein